MFIKITQSPHETWYNRRIGEVFETIDDTARQDNDGDYIVTKAGGIYCADYIEVNLYPTLKSNYFA